MTSNSLKDAAGWSSADDILNSSKDSSSSTSNDDDSCSIFFDMTLFPSTLSKSYLPTSSSDEKTKVMRRQSSKDDSECFSSTVPRPRKESTRFKGLDGPMSIARLKNGHFVVSEWRGNSISLLTKDGFRLLTFGRRQLSKESIIYNRLSGVPTKNCERHGQSIGELHEPTGLVVTKLNQILVVDSKNHRLQLFSYGGTPITTVGGRGGEGERGGGGEDDGLNFNFPYDICTDSSGRIYVSDTFNHRISVLTEKFVPCHQIGERGSTLGKFEYPLGLAMDQEGMLYVCDRDNSRVQKMTCYGRTVMEFKHDTIKYPVKVAVDGSNIVYVSYAYCPHVVMFDGTSGECIGNFGAQTRGGVELRRPRGILVDETGRVYVCDTTRNEIWLF